MGVGNGVIFVAPLPMRTIGCKQALKDHAEYVVLEVMPGPAFTNVTAVIARLLAGGRDEVHGACIVNA